MQPYFYPYLGYFQLINAVDIFILYDDVQYIKGGWINRNRILNNNRVQFIRLEMVGASSSKKINEIEVSTNDRWRQKLIRSIAQSYSKSQYFNNTNKIISDNLTKDQIFISDFLFDSISSICKELRINTRIVNSSTIYNNSHLSGEDRVIDICKKENASIYINPIGGRGLYSKDAFAKYDIELKFISMNSVCEIDYKNYVEGLSIIDILMNNDFSDIDQLLKSYTLTY